ncbi:GDSL-type esterase/lipase family protein [Lentzea sp. NPDC006480]|uniref:GDSL-type esterase/lipase family protein n=1 Tax=Lentzea sp. NPDC006480 TaxID=3157176 RepID=UPI0033BBB4D6
MLALLLVCGACGAPERSEPSRWLPVWQAVPSISASVPDQHVRTTVNLGAAGTSVRIHLSNLMSDEPVRIEQASVTADGQTRQLTFGDSRVVTIGPREEVYSDTVPLTVTKTLEISTYAPTGTPCQARANRNRTSVGSYVCLASRVDVAGFTAPGAVVMFGDSITEGGPEGNWPSLVQTDLAILNAGIIGNGVVHGDDPMTARVFRDVLHSSEVRKVVLLGGINDIQHDVSADDVIRGVHAIQMQCKNRGAQLIMGTVTPWRGWKNWSEERERQRQRLNEQIRAEFPDVIDFDAAVRDPADPLRLRPEFDSGDHLHPNAAAFGAMARLVRV